MLSVRAWCTCLSTSINTLVNTGQSVVCLLSFSFTEAVVFEKQVDIHCFKPVLVHGQITQRVKLI